MTVRIVIEINDDSSIEDVEKAIDEGLNVKGIDCLYEVNEE